MVVVVVVCGFGDVDGHCRVRQRHITHIQHRLGAHQHKEGAGSSLSKYQFITSSLKHQCLHQVKAALSPLSPLAPASPHLVVSRIMHARVPSLSLAMVCGSEGRSLPTLSGHRALFPHYRDCLL